VTETIVARPAQQPVQAQFDMAAIMGGLYGDGIIGYYEALPDQVKQHLTTRVVDELEPIVQAHSIEGLMMGEA
jgi:hypothetical protein